MRGGRLLGVLLTFVHCTHVHAEPQPGTVRVCEDQPKTLQDVSKLKLWRAATKYRSKLKASQAEVQGLKDRLESRSSTVAAAVLVAQSLPEPLEGPEPTGLGQHSPVWLWIGLGVAALGLSFAGGLAVGVAASR